MRTLSVLLVLASGLMTAEPPSAEISNGLLTARLYLPDPDHGYYRGTRFDWSGNMFSLRTAQHEYFGQWFGSYNPKGHDSIFGPVEEFRSQEGGLGYDEASVGGTFLRIGVGAVRKPQEEGYQIFKTYEIVDPGKWEIKKSRDRIAFTHRLQGTNGYGYRYRKSIVLEKGKKRMRIEHELENTGTKPIRTQQYNHNFFVIDGEPTGPNSVVQFSAPLQPTRPFANALAFTDGQEIRYRAELLQGQSTYGEFQGLDNYDIRMENRKAKAGVQIRGDRPISKLVYWSIRTTFCPEPFIDLAAEPGKTARWVYTYDFYELP